mgnify:CR=1 FL=1
MQLPPTPHNNSSGVVAPQPQPGVFTPPPSPTRRTSPIHHSNAALLPISFNSIDSISSDRPSTLSEPEYLFIKLHNYQIRGRRGYESGTLEVVIRNDGTILKTDFKLHQ